MLEESVRPPALYPDDFGTAATTILRNTFGLAPTGITMITAAAFTCL